MKFGAYAARAARPRWDGQAALDDISRLIESASSNPTTTYIILPESALPERDHNCWKRRRPTAKCKALREALTKTGYKVEVVGCHFFNPHPGFVRISW
jgi:hypothetical protein